MAVDFDNEAARLIERLPSGPRLVVLGSASFERPDSRELCQVIAAELASQSTLIAITGGMDGVGKTFSRAFAAARLAAKLPERLIHLLPEGSIPCTYGQTLEAGVSFYERRELLGRIGHVYLVIEGGPGTQHEASIVASQKLPIVPLARTGGVAGELYVNSACPMRWPADEWSLLSDTSAPHSIVAAAVGRLVKVALETSA